MPPGLQRKYGHVRRMRWCAAMFDDVGYEVVEGGHLGLVSIPNALTFHDLLACRAVNQINVATQCASVYTHSDFDATLCDGSRGGHPLGQYFH